MNFFTSNQDLFCKTTKKLYNNPEFKCNPRNLFIHEDLGFSGRIENPYDRLIFIPERHWDIVYGTGEFIWYVTGSDSLEFIRYYAPSYDRFSDDGKTLYGAYGSRLFKNEESDSLHVENAISSVIRKLKEDPDSRQALSMIWRQKDMHVFQTKDLPCTVSLQFLIRDNKLNMITTMRSNDVWLGSTNDIYCFTLLQELIASKLKIDLGFYQHNSGSMHLYEKNINIINEKKRYFFENHESIPMNKILNFHEQLMYLIRYEKVIRESHDLIEYKKIFNKRVLSLLSNGIRDLMCVFYYGKIRKLYKKNNKDIFKNLLKNCLEQINDESIKQCILSYEEIIL